MITNDERLIIIYELLVKLIYEIFLNNNSIEELNDCIASINEIINKQLSDLNSSYKFSLLIYTKRVSQLVYLKLQEIEKILISVKAKEVEETQEDEAMDNKSEEDQNENNLE